MQKTDFDFEIVIGEDYSTDNTRKICEDYANKYPIKINLLPSEKNYGMIPNFLRTFKYCTGKYIALCEGDDYWTDPYKLQKQVDFLEENDEFTMSTHDVDILWEGVSKKKRFYPNYITIASFEDLIIKGLFFHTNTMVLRSSAIEIIPEWFNKLTGGQLALSLWALREGKNYHYNYSMGVKRKNLGGVSQNLKRLEWLKKNRFKIIIFFYNNLKRELNGKKDNIINMKIRYEYYNHYKLKIKLFLKPIFFPILPLYRKLWGKHILSQK